MIGCAYNSSREPQCPVIVDYRNSLSCIEWGFLAGTCTNMVSSTLGCTIFYPFMFSCCMGVLVPDPLWQAQLYVEHADRVSHQVIIDENQLGYSCMLVKQDMDPVQSTWHK